eukprot:28550-Pelagococcus_subviridis.AAC.2
MHPRRPERRRDRHGRPALLRQRRVHHAPQHAFGVRPSQDPSQRQDRRRRALRRAHRVRDGVRRERARQRRRRLREPSIQRAALQGLDVELEHFLVAFAAGREEQELVALLRVRRERGERREEVQRDALSEREPRGASRARRRVRAQRERDVPREERVPERLRRKLFAHRLRVRRERHLPRGSLVVVVVVVVLVQGVVPREVHASSFVDRRPPIDASSIDALPPVDAPPRLFTPRVAVVRVPPQLRRRARGDFLVV